MFFFSIFIIETVLLLILCYLYIYSSLLSAYHNYNSLIVLVFSATVHYMALCSVVENNF